MSVRTRFAPSPTGFLHIGGVRTALFNWLLARKAGGQFILRIDDTDRDRNIEKALKPILDGFRWLGIDWDEGPEVEGPHAPYFQSQRNEKYQTAVDQLLAGGFAYRDYSQPEEFQAEREAAEKEKRSFVYSRRWLAETDEDAARFESEGRSAVIRLKMPRDGACQFDDLVRGNVSVNWNEEPDHVIQRANGTFIYHLANVVDDEDYRISHVVRAVEHLPNTPRQIFMIQSLGYQMPIYAHVPYVAEPGSQNKLSKRKIAKYMNNREFKKLYEHGLNIASKLGVEEDPESFNPVLIDFYSTVGYLPDAILNYLLLLGWSLDDKTEEFTRQEMIEGFSLDRVVKSPASFDPLKLMAFEDRKMQALPVKQKVAKVLPFLQAAGLVSEPSECEMGPYLTKIVTAAGDRIKVAGDILEFDDFFADDADLKYNDKAFQKRLVKPDNAAELLSEFKTVVESAEGFDAAATEKLLHDFVEAKGIKIGDIIHALRVALTGKASGFGMFDTMEILGRDRCVLRIQNTLAKLNG
jgi:glutamyl-tRNA synthetase